MNEEEQEDPGGDPRVSVEDLAASGLDPDHIRRHAERVLDLLGVDARAHLSITLVDAEQIAELKRDAFGVHAATDVLSFPMDDPADPGPGPFVLGDLVLCPAVAATQARALGHDLVEETEQLVTHGLLHLMGREHATPADEIAMAEDERRLLQAVRA